MDIEKLKTALVPLIGARDEINTIVIYANQLIELSANSELSEDIIGNYAEIIGDELNHISRFMELFISLSKIPLKEDK